MELSVRFNLTIPAYILTAIFIVLKVASVISWSWLWVLSPLWIAGLVGMAFYLFFKVIKLMVEVLVLIFDKK